MSQAEQTLEVVIPLFNEEEILPELFTRLTASLEAIPGIRWKVRFVDDGSRDQTVSIVNAQAARDPRFCLHQLSRNFGHQPAISAGILQTGSDAVVVMDADLQDPPELIAALVDKWREGNEIVRAERLSRAESGWRRVGFDLFHRFFNRLSDFPIPANSGTFSLLDRVAVDALRQLPERHRFFPGLCAWVGFRQAAVTYHRDERQAGTPKQNLRRLVRYSMDALFSFSYVPLRLMTLVGLAISMLGFMAAFFFALRRLLGMEIAVTGFTTLFIVVVTLGGLQLIAIGVIGEYLGRVYDEVKKRPYFILRPCVKSESDTTAANSSGR